MSNSVCKHQWKTINVKSGYLVTEGCPHCAGRRSFFTLDDRNHMDTYVEGKHRWRFLGSSQAVKFDLECEKCGEVVNLSKMMALLLCIQCMEDCEAGKMARLEGDEKVWVYLALCGDPNHVSGECVGERECEVLTEYFNSRISTPGKRILIVPCKLRPSIDLCQGEILTDVGMKEIF